MSILLLYDVYVGDENDDMTEERVMMQFHF